MAGPASIHTATAIQIQGAMNDIVFNAWEDADAVQEKLARSAATLARLPMQIEEIEEARQNNPQHAHQLCAALEGEPDSSTSPFSPQEINEIVGDNPLPEADRTAARAAHWVRGLTEYSNQQKERACKAEKDAKLPEIHGINNHLQELLKPHEEDIEKRNKDLELLENPNPHPRDLKSQRNTRTAMVTSAADLEELRSLCGENLILKEELYLGDTGIPKGARLCDRKMLVETDQGLCHVDIWASVPRGAFTGHVEFELPGSVSTADMSQAKLHKNSARREALLTYIFAYLMGPPSKPRLELQSKVHSNDNRVDECAKEIEDSISSYRTMAQSHLEEVASAFDLSTKSFLSFDKRFETLKALLRECRDEKDKAENELTECRIEAQDLYHDFVDKVEEYTQKKLRRESMEIRMKMVQKVVDEQAAVVHRELSEKMATAEVTQENMKKMVAETFEQSEKCSGSLRNYRAALAHDLDKKLQTLQRSLELLMEEAALQTASCAAKESELEPIVEQLTVEADSIEDEDLAEELRQKAAELRAVQAQKRQAKRAEAIARALWEKMPPKTTEFPREAVEDEARKLYKPLKVKAQRNSNALAVPSASTRQRREADDRASQEHSMQLATQELEIRREILRLQKQMDQVQEQVHSMAEPESRSTTSGGEESPVAMPLFTGAAAAPRNER